MYQTNLKGNVGQPRDKAMSDRNSNDQGFIWLFFSFQGRLSRLGFLGGNLLLLMAGFASSFASKVVFLFVALQVFLFWAGISLGAKRLHDMSLSGFWVLLPFSAFTALFTALWFGAASFIPSLIGIAILLNVVSGPVLAPFISMLPYMPLFFGQEQGATTDSISALHRL
jgi:uncharacterized membrane protein YhaH (DUF805 family)